MKNFGPFLYNLRISAGLSLDELAKLVNSSKSGISRLENNEVPQPFKGTIHKLVISLAEVLCTSKQEIKRYIELAEIDPSILTEIEQIQVGIAPTITGNTLEDIPSLQHTKNIYQELITRLETKKAKLGNPTPTAINLRIQEYTKNLNIIQKRINDIYRHQDSAEQRIAIDMSQAEATDDTKTELQVSDTSSVPRHETHSSLISTDISPLLDLEITDKLDNIEAIINLAWESWFASRPKAAARSINKLLPKLEKIAYSPYPPHQTLRAKELTIRAHGLLGSICADAVQNDTALFHYMQAHRFAEEIHDKNLTATYLCLIGEVLRLQKDQFGALSYMESAKDAASHASKATRGHILQTLAYAYGDTGQEAAFERTISEATDLLAFSGEGRDIEQKEFIPFEIHEIRGKVYRDLGKPLDAIPYLELAEKSLLAADSVTPRWHALLEISRGQTFCDAGDIATGLELARKGFIMAYQCHSQLQMNRVRKLLRKLETHHLHNHRGVQDLKDLIYETYMRIDSDDTSKHSHSLT